MRVEPFSTLEALADCKPGSLVRDVKDNTLGLVVAQKALEPKTTGCLLRLERHKPDQPVVPCYRVFTDPCPVLVYNNQDYVFLIDDSVQPGSMFSGGSLCETHGALLLNGSAWYMCLVSGQDRQAYDIRAGTLVAMPKLDETRHSPPGRSMCDRQDTTASLGSLSPLGASFAITLSLARPKSRKKVGLYCFRAASCFCS